MINLSEGEEAWRSAPPLVSFDVEITRTWDWRGFAASRSQALR